jgi:hypothetical protein
VNVDHQNGPALPGLQSRGVAPDPGQAEVSQMRLAGIDGGMPGSGGERATEVRNMREPERTHVLLESMLRRREGLAVGEGLVRFAVIEDRRFALPYRVVVLDETGQPFMVVTGSMRGNKAAAEKILRQIEECPLCRANAAKGDHPGHGGNSAFCETKLPHCGCATCRGDE